MDKSIRVNDLIRLREDIPQHDLRAERIGRITAILPSDQMEVEFPDRNGHPIAKLPLRLDEIGVLRHEVTLDAKGFWTLIEDARAQCNDDVLHNRELVHRILAKHSVANIVAFGDIYSLYLRLALRQMLWKAAAIIDDYYDSESSFWDFRDWLIDQGEQVYHDALHDPESLVNAIDLNAEDNVLDIMERCSVKAAGANYRAYELKTGDDWPDGSIYLSATHEDYGIDTSFVPPTDDEWVYWELDEAIQKYPRLAAKFRPNYKSDDFK
jgi:hypothetical protein